MEAHSAHLTLVLGGARSGKSRYAESIVTALPEPWIYVATAQPLDEEMRSRISTHRARRGPGWSTVEAPINLASAIAADAERPMLVDCLTMWVSNLLADRRDMIMATAKLDEALNARRAPTVLVANEVGLDMGRLEKDMASDEAKETIDENLKMAEALGLNGTPSYVIGTDVVVGAVGLTALKEKVAAAR